MKSIVIIGAGFGGLKTALNLAKKVDDQVQITLVDKRDYHLFTPNLYEVASSEEELTTIAQMEKSLTLPIKEVIYGTNIKFVQKEVVKILPKEKKVQLAQGDLNYDYLVMATGSQSDFFNIKGAEANALTLKNLTDAFRIRNKIEFAVQSQQMDVNKKTVRIVVAGGGYTGLELAAELKGLADILAIKYSYPREKIEIQVIEANNKLIAGFDDRLSVDAYNRLSWIGVRVSISARISEVDEHFVFLMSGEKVAYDVLVWTTGIKAVTTPFSDKISLDGKGKICVNEFMQSVEFPEIFALGDNAAIFDSQKKPVPATAQDAGHEAEYLAYSITCFLNNKAPKAGYNAVKHGFIVTLGGKWAIMSYNGVYLTGFVAWFVDQLAHLRYYASIVGWFKAVKYIVFQMEMYSRND